MIHLSLFANTLQMEAFFEVTSSYLGKPLPLSLTPWLQCGGIVHTSLFKVNISIIHVNPFAYSMCCIHLQSIFIKEFLSFRITGSDSKCSSCFPSHCSPLLCLRSLKARGAFEVGFNAIWRHAARSENWQPLAHRITFAHMLSCSGRNFVPGLRL